MVAQERMGREAQEEVGSRPSIYSSAVMKSRNTGVLESQG